MTHRLAAFVGDAAGEDGLAVEAEDDVFRIGAGADGDGDEE